MTTATLSLKERWAELLAQDPKMRIRNAAQALGVSEAELLATRVGDGVVRLRSEHRAIMKEIGSLGRVIALTRNDDVVHERKGIYLNPSINPGPVGLYVGDDIDLRIFWEPWAYSFAVTEPGKDAPRRSLQFFGSDGEAVHKVYLIGESDGDAYDALVAKYRAEDQDSTVATSPWPAPPAERPDSSIDVAAFRAEWMGLQDTHDFYGMLKKHGVSRTQALRLAPGPDHAVRVNNTACRVVLTRAAQSRLPIMVFVGNKGMIQIHTGPVIKLADVPGWFNVLDPDFNLHLREAAITESWVVRKPTKDGIVTALECYDAKGELLVQLFGKRKPGIPELEEWRSLVAAVEAEQRTA
jgi:putative hemin transport protein